MKRLFYVRHGETEYNVRHRWSGQAETRLTDSGIAQARIVGEELAKQKFHADRIIGSPFERAYDTDRIIAEAIDYPVSDIREDDRFVERSYGTLEGTLEPDNLDFRAIERVPGVETVAALQERAIQAFDYLRSLRAYDTVLVVGHGAFGRALRRVIKGIPPTDEFDTVHRVALKLPNAQVVELL